MKTLKHTNQKIVPFERADKSRTTSYVEVVEAASREAFQYLLSTPGFQRIVRGEITAEEYKSVMKEIYYYTRETPQMLGVLSSRLRGHQRDAIKVLFKHGISEIGHDQMALNDVQAMGEDREKIITEQPLPSTTALLGYAYYQIDRLEPAGFLGFLYFLEYIANAGGESFIENLKKAGVPETALSFISEHTEVDPAHNKLLGKYVECMILNDHQLQSVIYSIRCTAELYGQMITRAIENVAHPYPRLICSEESSKIIREVRS